MLSACMHRPISQPNWVRLERWKYLLNRGNIKDLSEYIIQPKHASLCECTLCAYMHGPISQLNWNGSERSKYLWSQEESPTFLSTYFNLCMEASVHATYVLHAQAHISAKLCRIREIKVSMESGEPAWPLCAHNLTRACKLACMHAMCLRVQAYISAKLGQLREIKVSMESGEQANISAKLGQIREINVSIESGGHGQHY